MVEEQEQKREVLPEESSSEQAVAESEEDTGGSCPGDRLARFAAEGAADRGDPAAIGDGSRGLAPGGGEPGQPHAGPRPAGPGRGHRPAAPDHNNAGGVEGEAGAAGVMLSNGRQDGGQVCQETRRTGQFPGCPGATGKDYTQADPGDRVD